MRFLRRGAVRAVQVVRPGGLDVLRVGEVSVRPPGPGEVSLEVRAAAVNPTDVNLRRRGITEADPPWVPGMDAAGVVSQVGPGVDRLAPGDAVMATVTPRRPEGGAQAEVMIAPAASVVPVPNGASFAEASTLPMNGLTAMLGLEMLALPPGSSLVVSGGAGLLASYVIPLAKRRGLHVVADAAGPDEELVRGFGADLVLPRDDAFPSAARQALQGGADAVFDTALLGHRVLSALRDGGAMAVVRGWDGSTPERGIQIHAVSVRTVLQRTHWLEMLRELAAGGELALRVVAELPPEDVAYAHRLLEEGGLRGRSVLVF